MVFSHEVTGLVTLTINPLFKTNRQLVLRVIFSKHGGCITYPFGHNTRFDDWVTWNTSRSLLETIVDHIANSL